MANVFFDGEGFKAEQLAVAQFGGKLLSDKANQYKDIDAKVPAKDGSMHSVSVKDQLWSSEKYGAIQIEMKLTNTRTGAVMNGCFPKCEAQYYFWRVWTEEHGDTWAIVQVARMKKLIEENKTSLKKWKTQEKTEAKNRSYGRSYDRAEGYVVPLELLKSVAQLKPVEGTKQ